MDISMLRERRSDSTMTVGELNSYIKSVFDTNRLLSSVTVRGEISNFVHHRSGHMYFSLKDEEGQIKAVMFRSSADNLKFKPESGMKVTAFGSVSVYQRDGAYQLYVSSMQPDGIGALYMAYEQLKKRLAEEGLFDIEHKKKLPPFPKRIGVITSPTGAAVRDIINITNRRYPIINIYLYPSLVQGERAEESLISALDYFDKSELVDLVIIGRGGGSIEDLWAFNGEWLARRIYAMQIPVISAVGHETDFTICDFVADLRAPTPSAAAELAVPDIRELMLRIDTVEGRCTALLKRSLENARSRLNSILSRKMLRDPQDSLFLSHKERLTTLEDELFSVMKNRFSEMKGALAINSGKLQALSPLAVLSRGYALAEKNGKALTSTKNATENDEIAVRLKDGIMNARVTKITPANTNGKLEVYE